MKKLDLVILAGGKGSRIKKYLNNKPKPMIEFNKISFLQYLINIYSKYPFRKIFILVGFKSKTIIKKYHKKVFNFTEITCLKERKPMGTGGALINLKRENIKDFVLINGDSIFNIDLVNFLSLISPTAICKEYNSELPNSENSPVRGAIKPTFRIFASSAFAILKLANKIK